jgi:hypothetical protein
MSEQRDEPKWLEVIRADLDRSADQLDSDTARRLAAARRAALARYPRRFSFQLLPVAIAAGACAILLAFVLSGWPGAESPADDLEFISSAGDLDFYRDLEFYEWLDEQGITG